METGGHGAFLYTCSRLTVWKFPAVLLFFSNFFGLLLTKKHESDRLSYVDLRWWNRTAKTSWWM